MYIGGTDLNAIHHMLNEVVDNSVQEFLAGAASRVQVELLNDGACRVTDDGYGIDVAPQQRGPDGPMAPFIEQVCTILQFGSSRTPIPILGGLHGVGMMVVNALSKSFTVETVHAGRVYSISFNSGQYSERLSDKQCPPDVDWRTRITFKPDPHIFPDTGFRSELIVARLRELAFVAPGLMLEFHDLRGHAEPSKRVITFHAPNGAADYVEYLRCDRRFLGPILRIQRNHDDMRCDIAMAFHDERDYQFRAFVNCVSTEVYRRGTHVDGFRQGVVAALKRYSNQAGFTYASKRRCSWSSFREGMTAVVSVMIPHPQLNDATRSKLSNPEVIPFVRDAVAEDLFNWLEQHSEHASLLCGRMFGL